LIRPKIEFPESFELGISSDDFGLNVTETIYFDQNKIRLQLFYAILGLEPTKGLDVVFDESNKLVALQQENECKHTHFGDSLLPVRLFFSMFNQLTEYKGQKDGFHFFKIKKLYENNPNSPNFLFIFDDQL
jgi:hypothetical protein